MTRSTSVTVCVVVKDRRELMLRCLEAVLEEHPDEVVVVDNGSTDGTWEALQERARDEPRLLLAQDGGSLGHIRNVAARLATSEVVAFTDSDCRPRRGWLDHGLAALAPGVAVVQGRTVPEVPPTGLFVVTQDISEPTGLYEACNVFYRREVLLEVGGFDEQVGFFGEDTVAGWSVERAGWRSGWAPDAVVEHVVTHPGFAWHLRRAQYFSHWPALLKAFPEKRDLLWHRVFLRRASAEADLALLSFAAAVVTRRPRLLLGAAPWLLRHRPRNTHRDELVGSTAGAVYDLAVSTALLRGSARERTPVL